MNKKKKKSAPKKQSSMADEILQYCFAYGLPIARQEKKQGSPIAESLGKHLIVILFLQLCGFYMCSKLAHNQHLPDPPTYPILHARHGQKAQFC